MPADEDLDNPPTRVSEETLEMLYEFASPTRVSLYDRPWFLWSLAGIGLAGVVAYIVYLAMH